MTTKQENKKRGGASVFVDRAQENDLYFGFILSVLHASSLLFIISSNISLTTCSAKSSRGLTSSNLSLLGSALGHRCWKLGWLPLMSELERWIELVLSGGDMRSNEFEVGSERMEMESLRCLALRMEVCEGF